MPSSVMKRNIFAVPNDKEMETDLRSSSAAGNIQTIYMEYSASVYNFIFYKLGSRAAAEDLTQDVFIKVMEKYSRYDAKKGEFKVWLFTIARNTLKDYIKKRKRHIFYSLDEPEFDELSRHTDNIEDKIFLKEELYT